MIKLNVQGKIHQLKIEHCSLNLKIDLSPRSLPKIKSRCFSTSPSF